MNAGAMEVFVEAMLNGGNTSAAIEAQERRGQQSIVRSQCIPIKSNAHEVPQEFLFKGVSDDSTPFKVRMEQRDKNIIEWTKAQYEAMGIKVIDAVDDLFYSVELPEGWEVKPTDHSMWNDVFDNKGRKRIQFFYKVAFYDRDAFSNFCRRFRTSVDHTAPVDSEYAIWEKSDFIGRVYDDTTVIFETEQIPAPESKDYVEEEKIKKQLSKIIDNYIKEHYPNYKDINAYWD